MERMEKKEKESGTLLGVGTAYLQAKEIKGVFYIKASDFNRCMDGIRIEQEADRKHIEELEEENKKLKEENENLEEINQKLLRDLDTVEEIKDRERIGLRERIEELEQELKDEKVKNKILRMKRK